MLDALSEARLFIHTGEWRLRPPSEYERIVVQTRDAGARVEVVRLVDLPDRTFLAYDFGIRGFYVVRLREDALGEPIVDGELAALAADGVILAGPARRASRERAREVPVVARSLSELLSRALRTLGDVALPEVARMADELQEWRRYAGVQRLLAVTCRIQY